MKRYNIIGDIHGRRCWEKLVDPSRINIFVGDYFDPYENIPFEDLKQTFLDIIQFTKTNPDTILLFGNHDLHYIHHRDSSRLDTHNEKAIQKLFEDNAHMFVGVAYAINDKVLVSHAGFTSPWLDATGFDGERTTVALADWGNNLLWDGFTEAGDRHYWDSPNSRGMYHFTFGAHAKFSEFDVYGTSPTQSPVWVRPTTLLTDNAIPRCTQIVGHTQVRTIIPDLDGLDGQIILIDCLGQDPASLLVDITDENNIIYNVNKLNK